MILENINSTSPEKWLPTWTRAPLALPESSSLAGRTFRFIVPSSIDGKALRIRISNQFGSSSLDLKSVKIALQKNREQIISGSEKPIFFGGKNCISIPKEKTIISDTVSFPVSKTSNIAISFFISSAPHTATIHPLGFQTSFELKEAATPNTEETESYYFLTGVDALTEHKNSAVAILGDSITDGVGSTPNKNNSWVSLLTKFANQQDGIGLAVANQGIAGNRVLHDTFGPRGIKRIDQEILTLPGLTHLVLFEGINDILISDLPKNAFDPEVHTDPVTVKQIIEGYISIIEKSKKRGLAVIGCTLLPYGQSGFYTEGGEQKREELNHWIRTSGAFDNVIDFDKILQDPKDPKRILPRYSTDGLHPNEEGHKKMAESISISIFKP